mgnify:CR=1 FL=1
MVFQLLCGNNHSGPCKRDWALLDVCVLQVGLQRSTCLLMKISKLERASSLLEHVI